MKKAIFIILILAFDSYFTPLDNNNSEVEIVIDDIELNADSYSIEPDDPILRALDSMNRMVCFRNIAIDTSHYILDHGVVPKYSNSVIKRRLQILDQSTPFNLVYNRETEAFIELYANKRRFHTAKMLGLSQMYFPMFEETLDRFGLPLEFKYLAVVESALNPRAKSPVGAAGLWQFMYRTGKIYGLDVDSYKDERSDPYKATVAACKYFKYLYKLYGNWELVLAAYNCGPGSVNKAIRRSGNKKDYWALWPYLPKETRGYVPAFIAINYVMNYSIEHNIYPFQPKKFFTDYDSIHVDQKIDLEVLASKLEIEKEELELLNPAYKLGVIPNTAEDHILYLPSEKVGTFVKNEELIYLYSNGSKVQIEPSERSLPELVKLTIRIKSKTTTINNLSRKYGVDIEDIKKWNKLKYSEFYKGQKIDLYISEDKLIEMGELKSKSKQEIEEFERLINKEISLEGLKPNPTRGNQ